MFPGPQTLAVTGDNSFETLFGRTWAILFCDDQTFHVLQWAGEGETPPEGLETGGWHVQTDPLLVLPEWTGSERAFTGAFDQSARLIIAYELDGVIRVTRWDTDAGAYVQNVTFEGRDPTLLMDASITRRVPDSDVILFYAASDRQSLHYRVQRETYGIARPLMWGDAETAVEYPEGVILDYAQAIPYRYELLIAESTGAKPPLALVSDLYPIPRGETLPLTVAPSPNEYRQETHKHLDQDTLALTPAAAPNAYTLMIARTAQDDGPLTTAPAVSPGTYEQMIYQQAAADGPFAMTAAPLPGTYDRTTFRDASEDGPFAVSAAVSRGAYRASS